MYYNPTYPYKPPFAGSLVTNYLDDSSSKILTQAPTRYRKLARATLFAISALEFNRALSPGVPYHWSVDMGFDQGVASPHFRLGGWSWATVLVFITMFAGSIFRSSKLSAEAIFLIAATAFTSVLPESHELRYFLFIPMCLALYCSAFGTTLSRRTQSVYLSALLIALGISVAGTGGLRVLLWKPEDFAASETRAAWAAYLKSDRTKALCVREDRYDGILWTGPKLLQFPVRAEPECHGYFVDEK